jgi:hypothetical protein
MSWQNDYPADAHWTEYISISPGMMGPNALPVPELYDGKIKSKAEFAIGGRVNAIPGDTTYSTSVYIYVPFVKNRVGIEVISTPKEYYTYSDELADKIHSLKTSGSESGDIYVNTYFQLLQQSGHRPDLTLRVGLKTASGGATESARFTDAPGYYFDLSAGKDIIQKGDAKLRLSAMLGFYCWQGYDLDLPQNDAPLYGGSISFIRKKFKAESSIRGYYGYKDNGDRPLVVKFKLDIPIYNNWSFRIAGEKGITDFLYTGISSQIVYSIPKK